MMYFSVHTTTTTIIPCQGFFFGGVGRIISGKLILSIHSCVLKDVKGSISAIFQSAQMEISFLGIAVLKYDV